MTVLSIGHRVMQSSEEDSGILGQVWGKNNDANFPLSLLSIAITVLFLVLRFYYWWKHRNDPPPPPPSPQPERQGPPKPRTPEFIENLLVLKRALWVSDDGDENKKTCPTDGSKESAELPSKSHRARQKSNLFLFDGDEESGMGTCSICLCEYEDGDQICWSHNQQCAHHFHAKCGIAWLAKHSECPICRAEYLVEPENDDDDDVEAGRSSADTADDMDGSSDNSSDGSESRDNSTNAENV